MWAGRYASKILRQCECSVLTFPRRCFADEADRLVSSVTSSSAEQEAETEPEVASSQDTAGSSQNEAVSSQGQSARAHNTWLPPGNATWPPEKEPRSRNAHVIAPDLSEWQTVNAPPELAVATSARVRRRMASRGIFVGGVVRSPKYRADRTIVAGTIWWLWQFVVLAGNIFLKHGGDFFYLNSR